MLRYITDHPGTPGWDDACWRPARPSPFTDGATYTITPQAAADFIAQAGAAAPVVDLENLPDHRPGISPEEMEAAYLDAATLTRTALGDGRRLRKNRRPIPYFGLWPADREGVRRILPVARACNCACVGGYIWNGPNRFVEREQKFMPTVHENIVRLSWTLGLFADAAPELVRLLFVTHEYVYADRDGSDVKSVVTDGDLALLDEAAGHLYRGGILHGVVYCVPRDREPDPRFLAAFN